MPRTVAIPPPILGDLQHHLATYAGLPQGSHPHDLGGWGATMTGRQGATTRELMHRLGHASVAMALRYQGAEQERDAILAAAMSGALRRS